jgi:hypothetical protein
MMMIYIDYVIKEDIEEMNYTFLKELKLYESDEKIPY